jgi:tetratricopeptide (TPR) repeat protein
MLKSESHFKSCPIDFEDTQTKLSTRFPSSERVNLWIRSLKGGVLMGFFRKSKTEPPNPEDQISEDGVVCFNQAVVYDQKGDYDRAIEKYDQVIKLNPQFVPAYQNLGALYCQKGDLDRAIQNFEQVIKLNPQDELTYVNLGGVYYAKSDYDRAIQNLDQAIKLNPNNLAAYNNRGATHSQIEKYDLARKDYQKAKELGDPDAQGMLDLLDKHGV